MRVGEHEVLGPDAEVEVHACARDAGRAGAGEHDADLLDGLADDVEGVEERGAGDDRGAVLVVVEHRDVQQLAERLLDVEALRRLDVLEVDAAEGRGERRDDADQLVRVEGGQLDVEHVDAGEPLEQHGLAFHHRLGGERPDVAEAEHGGAVRDDADEVALARVAVHRLGVVVDGEAGARHTRRVGQRQVPLRDTWLRRDDLELPGPRMLVIVEDVFVPDHHSPPFLSVRQGSHVRRGLPTASAQASRV